MSRACRVESNIFRSFDSAMHALQELSVRTRLHHFERLTTGFSLTRWFGMTKTTMRLLTQLLIASYLPAVAVAQESDPPSDVPSMTPTSSDRPSQVPTFLPTMTKPSAPQPTGPQTGSCQEVGCQSFADTDSLKAFVSGLSGTATLCLCPTEYSTAKSNCVDADAEETAVVVSNGQDITLECDATTGDTCLFACPDVVFGVSEGGKLTVMGNGVTVLTGGSVFSRMEVQVGGVATVEDVTFREYVLLPLHLYFIAGSLMLIFLSFLSAPQYTSHTPTCRWRPTALLPSQRLWRSH